LPAAAATGDGQAGEHGGDQTQPSTTAHLLHAAVELPTTAVYT